MVRIRSGETEVLASGTVIQFRSESIEFVLEPQAPELKVRCVFLNDKGEKENITKSRVEDNRTLVLDFVNFNNPLQVGNKEPIPIGSISDRPLFLSYRIINLENVGKLFHYSFYLGQKGIAQDVKS